MSIDTIDVSINFDKYLNKNKKYSFICPYINETTLENLFEIISILFPNQNICPCFKYEIENDGKYYLIDKNKTINEYIDEYDLNKISLKIYNEIHKSCNFQSYYQKSKREIIEFILNYQNNINTLKKENENVKININVLTQENENLKKIKIY